MINMTIIMIIMISGVMIMTKVSFAGASLVTSFFLARRGKAFLEPGQDLEAAVNRYMNEYSYSMIFMIFTSMTNDQIKSIYSLARCWPTLLRPLRFSPLKQRFLWKKYCIFPQIDDWRIILVIKHELVQYGIYSFLGSSPFWISSSLHGSSVAGEHHVQVLSLKCLKCYYSYNILYIPRWCYESPCGRLVEEALEVGLGLGRLLGSC